MQNNPPRLRVSAVIAFLVTALISSILIVSALVLELGALIGSHLLSMVIVGVVVGVVSWVIYAKTLRPVFRDVEQQIYSAQQFVSRVSRVCECVVGSILSRIKI